MHATNKTKLHGGITLACLTALLSADICQGALTQIQVTAVNGVSGITSKAYNNDSVLVIEGISAQTSWAGSWTAKIVGGYIPPTPYALNGTFTAFCTDIANIMANSGPGGYSYEARAFSSGTFDPFPEVGGAPPDPNWANSGSGGRAAWIYNTYIGSVVDATTRSAMALAIWEALYEGSGTYDVTAKSATGRSFAATGAGDKNVAGTVAYIANGWLAAGVAASPPFGGYNYTWWAEQQSTVYGDVQSLVGPWALIPEPTTYLAAALLLLPFLGSTLRIWRQRRS